MTKQEINDFIDKQHYKTYYYLKDRLEEHFPNVDDKEIKRILDKRLKDRFVKRSEIEPYMVKIFSSNPNAWFHDLMDNGKNNPRYWHIFIGANNHYAVALPLESKKASDVHKTLSQFISQYHPSKLTSDEESAFIEKNNLKLLSDNNVLVHTISDKNHSALGIIDRFIRTLRDLNTPHQHSKHQSHDEKYTFITPDRMTKLLNTYNTTKQSRIDCTPKEMFTDSNIEKEYIYKCLEKRDKQLRIKDFKYNPGDYVRYILPRSNGIVKKRYQISRECYKIEEKCGNMYVLIAKDGTTITKPRFQLLRCKKDGSKPNNIKWASTIPNKWNGVIKEIISYDKAKNKYKVLFSVPNGEDYEDVIPASYLRGNYPQVESDLEKEFHKNK